MTDAELANYGASAEPEPAAEPVPDWVAAIQEQMNAFLARIDDRAGRPDAASAEANQSARQDAERDAERRAEMAQAGIDEPVAREPQAGPESTPEREQLAADLTEIRERVAAIDEAVKQTLDREAERAAEIDAAGEDEPVAHGPQADEPELEPSWQRGEASADSEAWAPGPQPAAQIQDAEPELEI